MDTGLFKKYNKQIDSQKNSKKEIREYIQEHTGIELSEEVISISKKKITLTISSVQKSKLLQKKVKELLIQKGYTLTI